MAYTITVEHTIDSSKIDALSRKLRHTITDFLEDQGINTSLLSVNETKNIYNHFLEEAKIKGY